MIDHFYSLDIETTGLDYLTDSIHGIGIVEFIKGIATSYNYYSPSDFDPSRFDGAILVGHNLRFDLKFLIKAGLAINYERFYDTKVMAQLLNENRPLGLKSLVPFSALKYKQKLDQAMAEVKAKDLGQFVRDYGDQYYDIIKKYCLEDCYNSGQLFLDFYRKLSYSPKLLSYFEKEAAPMEEVILHMELRGIKVDLQKATEMKKDLERKLVKLEDELTQLCAPEIEEFEEYLYELAISKRKSEKGKAKVKRHSSKYNTKFNWKSRNHLEYLIYKALTEPTELVVKGLLKKTEKGNLDTSASHLQQIASSFPKDRKVVQVIDHLLFLKKVQKIYSTYIGDKKGMISKVKNGRIYPQYDQAGDAGRGGTVTGRLSSYEPNIQTLPRDKEIADIKSIFICDDDEHIFVYFDYSQLELRLAAHLSQDEVMIQAFNQGLDLHKITASKIFNKSIANLTSEERTVGKRVNFAMIYGASPYRLSSILNQPVERCEAMIKSFFRLYSRYRAYLEEQKNKMLELSLITTEAGRVRRLPDITRYPAYSREWKHALKQGYNFPIQSLGASITKRAMIKLYELGYDLVTQVHDSVVVQVKKENAKEEARKIVQIAENIYPLRVPLKVDFQLTTSLST